MKKAKIIGLPAYTWVKFDPKTKDHTHFYWLTLEEIKNTIGQVFGCELTNQELGKLQKRLEDPQTISPMMFEIILKIIDEVRDERK